LIIKIITKKIGTKMTEIYNPPHPGLTLKEDILPALDLTVTEASKQLGITRAAFSRVINGKAGISPEMALRIEAWLGEENGGSASVWLSLQANYDLWQVRKSGLPKVKHAFIPTLV
jgi:addiction module HigA family antidote